MKYSHWVWGRFVDASWKSDFRQSVFGYVLGRPTYLRGLGEAGPVDVINSPIRADTNIVPMQAKYAGLGNTPSYGG